MFRLKTLHGAALQNALIAIARYLVGVKAEYGAVDVAHSVSKLNERFQLVEPMELPLLTADVNRFYLAIHDAELQSMSRLGYAKFNAMKAQDKIQELTQQLYGIFQSPQPQYPMHR